MGLPALVLNSSAHLWICRMGPAAAATRLARNAVGGPRLRTAEGGRKLAPPTALRVLRFLSSLST